MICKRVKSIDAKVNDYDITITTPSMKQKKRKTKTKKYQIAGYCVPNIA